MGKMAEVKGEVGMVKLGGEARTKLMHYALTHLPNLQIGALSFHVHDPLLLGRVLFCSALFIGAYMLNGRIPLQVHATLVLSRVCRKPFFCIASCSRHIPCCGCCVPPERVESSEGNLELPMLEEEPYLG